MNEKIKRKLISIRSLRNTSIFIVVIFRFAYTVLSRSVYTTKAIAKAEAEEILILFDKDEYRHLWIPIFASFEWIQTVAAMMGEKWKWEKNTTKKNFHKKSNSLVFYSNCTFCRTVVLVHTFLTHKKNKRIFWHALFNLGFWQTITV